MKHNRRFLAAMLAALMLVAIAPFTFAAENAGEIPVEIRSFSSDTFGILAGKTAQVSFFAKLNTEPSQAVYVLDENGERAAQLFDDGKGSDECAHDLTYSGSTTLSSKTSKKATYHVQVGDVTGGEHKVAFHKDVTAADWRISDEIWAEINRREAQMELDGLSDAAIVDAISAYLSANPYVEGLERSDTLTLSFTFTSGIENAFCRFTAEAKAGVGSMDIEGIIEDYAEKAGPDYITENTIGVWSPYYGYDSSFSYNYRDRANAVSNSLGHNVDTYYGAQASVASFKNFDRYGLIMVDSHGAETNGGGYICIPAPGSYDRQDVVEGHLVQSGSDIFLTGTFFQKYCDTLPNSVVYIGICYGMAANHLSAPLLSHGAAFCCGYNNSVSFYYDGRIMDTFINALASKNTRTGELYTTGEAWEKARNDNGSADPYGHSAQFIYAGNANMRILRGINNVTGVSVSPSDLRLYRNNTYTLTAEVSPYNATDYSVEWSSDNSSVASVDRSSGVVTAKADGSAEITCSVKDNAEGGSQSRFTASCYVTVNGTMPVTSISVNTPYVELALDNNSGVGIDYSILPANASDKTVMFTSNDTSVAIVGEDGIITPVATGEAMITLTARDGGAVAYALCRVVETDVQKALCANGGSQNIANSLPYSWAVNYSQSGRVVIASGNAGRNNSTSSVTVNAGNLSEGDVVSFDWRVSCEEAWDVLSFSVNGTRKTMITGETEWSEYTYSVLSSGNYIFTFDYIKDSSGAKGDDMGYVDNFDIDKVGIMHTVVFMDMDGTQLATDYVGHAMAANAPVPPQHDDYVFVTWDGLFDEVRKDMTLTAVYMRTGNVAVYNVRFVDYDGSLILESEVVEGEAAVAPADPQRTGFIFTGWDTDFARVMSNLTVKATYSVAGDVTLDGKLNTGDAVMLLRYCASMTSLSALQLKLADINLDTRVNTGDAVAILKACAN